MKTPRLFALLTLCLFSFAACANNNDNAHTTVTIPIQPPPHQVLTVNNEPVPRTANTKLVDTTVDPTKPYLVFYLDDKQTFRSGEPVPIDFTVTNAKLKGDGGEYRVRYIVDDEEMKWLETAQPFWLTGWTSGSHTVRVELIGPDGWPYKNGNANIVTREITVR
jgi:hypothetical protein